MSSSPDDPSHVHPNAHAGPAADLPKPYDAAAAGWGATKSIAREVMRSGAPMKCLRTLHHLNQPDGVDCPGCAWPEPDHKAALEFCENGAKHVAWEATSKRVGRAFFKAHPVTELREQTDRWLEEQGRLEEPMSWNRLTDCYEPIGWDAAFERIAGHLRDLPSPDALVLYTSGRASNEAAFLYGLLGRQFGTNNFPDCSNMCHESSGVALAETIGVGKGTVSLHDFELADAIFVLGQNPGTNHPRMLSALQAAHQRGAEIVTFNPLQEVGLQRFLHPKHPGAMLTNHPTDISTMYLQVLVGGDLAALTGVAKCLLEAEDAAPGTVLDAAFIAEHTDGFDAFAAAARAAEWPVIERESGLTEAALREVATIYMRAERSIICWAMGLTQHKHAVPTLQMVVNLLLMRGQIGKPGAGACPVRGHSNVQGDRTVGIHHHPPAAFVDALDAHFGIRSPRAAGYDTVEAIRAMRDGDARVFFGLGGNFVRATPDSDVTAAALSRCRLTVHIATKLNHTHLTHGPAADALLLPCLGRTEIDRQASGEQCVSVEDSMSMVHASHGRLAPGSRHLRSEPAIIAGIGAAMFGDAPVNWRGMAADYDRIRDAIAAVIPGFEDYNRRCREPGGFFLGNAARDRVWHTATGKARFTATEIPRLGLPAGQLRLMTIRSHDQFNTTVYSDDDRYRGIHGNRHVVFLHPQDIAERGLRGGQVVDLVSHWTDGERQAHGFTVTPYDIPVGCAAAYFPEANVLVPLDSVADKSNCPTSKFVAITIHASSGSGGG